MLCWGFVGEHQFWEKMHRHTAIKTRVGETALHQRGPPWKTCKVKKQILPSNTCISQPSRVHSILIQILRQAREFENKICSFLSPEIHLLQQPAEKLYLNEIYPSHRSRWHYTAPHLKQTTWYQTQELLMLCVCFSWCVCLFARVGKVTSRMRRDIICSLIFVISARDWDVFEDVIISRWQV